MHARLAFLGAVLLAAALAACGGGGGGGGTPATATPTATPCATPAGGGIGFCGTTATAAVPLAAGATTTYSATMNFSAGSGTATIAASTTAPAGAATLDAAHMRIATAGGKLHAADSAPYTTLAYITLTATSNISLSSMPTIAVTTPSGATGAYYNAQGYWVTLPQSGTFTLASGASAYFAIYTGGTLPSPNPDGCVGVQADATSRTGAHAAAVGVQPIGAAISYSGTLTETIARATPCAMPTATQQATVTVSVSATSSPYATDEHSVESDAYTTETTSTVTDASVATTTVGSAAAFSESAETSTDEVGDKTVTTYSTPLVYGIASPLPYTGTITNAPPSTVQAYLADSTTTSRTYDTANGSYTEQDTIAGGGENQITVNADFSGNYTVDSGFGQLEAAFSAPSGGAITFTETLGGSTLASFALPQWWTGTSLYSDTTVDEGEGALPSPCNPSPAVSSADDFRRTIAIIDPVLGYTETETIDAFVVKNYVSTTTVGPACVVIADTQELYYDYFYDTPYSIYLSGSGTPLQTDTIAEAYWYASAPTNDSSVRTQSESPGGIPGLAANIAAHASGIAFTRATQRAARIENFVRSVAAGHVGGGVK